MQGKLNKLDNNKLDEIFIDRLYSACKYLKQDASWYMDKPYRYAKRMMESAERLYKIEQDELRKELKKKSNNNTPTGVRNNTNNRR